jgi:hypothetical protein
MVRRCSGYLARPIDAASPTLDAPLPRGHPGTAQAVEQFLIGGDAGDFLYLGHGVPGSGGGEELL